MSISNLLVPNNFNIFVGSITSSTVEPLPIDGKLTVTNNTPDGTANININQTDLTATTNDIQFSSNGNPIFLIGEDPTNSDSYVWAEDDLKIGTNFTERIRIPAAGIANDNTITNILGLQGTTLVYKNNFITPSSAETLTNKIIDSGDNLITISTTGDNINDMLDQRVTTTSSVNFLDVTTVGSVSAGGAMECSQMETNAINSPGLGTNCQINGVNPLTTSNNLASHVASTAAHGATGQVVGTTNTQTLMNKSFDTIDYTTVIPTTILKTIPFSFTNITTSGSQILYTINTVTDTCYYVMIELIAALPTQRAAMCAHSYGGIANNDGGVINLAPMPLYNWAQDIGSGLTTDAGISANGTNIEVTFYNFNSSDACNISGTVTYYSVT